MDQPFRSKALHDIYKAFLRTLIARYSHEQSVPSSFIFISYFLYFVISAAAFLSMGSTFGLIGNFLDVYRKHITGFGCFYITVLVGLEIWKMWLGIKKKVSAQATVVYRTAIYLSVSFTCVVYPLMVWAYSSMICALAQKSSGQTLGQFCVISVFVGIGALINILELIIRNNVPSKYQLSTISRFSELIAYMIVVVEIALSRPVANMLMTNSSRSAALICMGIILFGNLLQLSIGPVFWHFSMNAFFTFINLTLFAVHILGANPIFDNKSSLSLSLLLVASVMAKLSSILESRFRKINLQNKNLKLNKRYLGGLFMHYYLSQEFSKMNNKTDQELHVHYMGIWCKEKYGKWTPGAVRNAAYGINEEELQDYLTRMFSKYPQSFDHLKGLLLLQLMKEFPTLKDLRGILGRLEQRKSKNGLIGSIELYHYRKLYEKKLDLIYKGKVTKFDLSEKKSGAIELFQIYEHMLVACEGEGSNEEYLDIFKAFKQITICEDLVKEICEEINTKIKIFRQLITTPQQSSSWLFNTNQVSLKHHNKVLNTLKNHHLNLASPPSYQFPIFLFYFSKVRHSHQNFIGLLKSYKYKLNSILGLRVPVTIGQEDWNSLTMQIDLSAEKCGSIMGMSLNYFEFLGHSNTGSPLGQNLNDLIPGTFSKKHRLAMSGIGGSLGLETHPQELFMTGFDGMLRKCKGAVKVFPSLKHSVSSVSQLWFDKDLSQSLVLVDQNMQIINAERSFWDIFDSISSEEKLHNFNQISKSVGVSIFLSSRLQQLLEFSNNKKKDHHASHHSDQSGSDIFTQVAVKMTTELVEVNKRLGIRYQIDQCSIYYKHPSRTTLSIQHDYHESLGVPIVRLYVILSAVSVSKLEKESTNRFSLTSAFTRKPNRNDLNMNSDPDEDGGEDSSSVDGSMNILDDYYNIGDGDHSGGETQDQKEFDKIIKPAVKLMNKWKQYQMKSLINPLDAISIQPSSHSEIRKLEEFHITQIFGAIMNMTITEEERRAMASKGMVIQNVLMDEVGSTSPNNRANPHVKKDFLRAATKKDILFRKAAQVKMAKIFNKEEHAVISDNMVSHNIAFSDRKPIFQAGLSPQEQASEAFKERAKNRLIQERMANSSNIVIASSNSISMILNKVMVGRSYSRNETTVRDWRKTNLPTRASPRVFSAAFTRRY